MYSITIRENLVITIRDNLMLHMFLIPVEQSSIELISWIYLLVKKLTAIRNGVAKSRKNIVLVSLEKSQIDIALRTGQNMR